MSTMNSSQAVGFQWKLSLESQSPGDELGESGRAQRQTGFVSPYRPNQLSKLWVRFIKTSVVYAGLDEKMCWSQTFLTHEEAYRTSDNSSDYDRRDTHSARHDSSSPDDRYRQRDRSLSPCMIEVMIAAEATGTTDRYEDERSRNGRYERPEYTRDRDRDRSRRDPDRDSDRRRDRSPPTSRRSEERSEGQVSAEPPVKKKKDDLGPNSYSYRWRLYPTRQAAYDARADH
ncbi:unnamed protein product [Ranitomeya imitator]|uniref:Uncharacterized protein n=1 Tax=Ranitomeya imitator TaxID=111125 RepID=A0ABN9L1K9_9NEOB|nr:unnamed protein product [Ranitomeya imitator]